MNRTDVYKAIDAEIIYQGEVSSDDKERSYDYRIKVARGCLNVADSPSTTDRISYVKEAAAILVTILEDYMEYFE